MQPCAECRKMIQGSCSASSEARATLGRPVPPPPLGACMIPIAEDYVKMINNGMRVLEIGCGSWSVIKDRCYEVGATYEGIDTRTEYFGNKTIATRLENLAELSFPDNYFDLVIGMQTMEHWPEQKCSLQWGLYQCFRVCKFYGRILMNVPINFHGSRIFMSGNLKKIKKIFLTFSSQVKFEPWGFPSYPLPPLICYPGWVLRKKISFIVDIQAIKDKELSGHYHNSIYQGRWSYIRYAQIYPLSYCFDIILRDFRRRIVPKYFGRIFNTD